MSNLKAVAQEELSLQLEDLEIEDLMAVELHEEAKGLPENLASSVFNCTSVSSMVMAV